MDAPFPSPPQSPAGPVVSQVGSLAGLFWGQSLATVPETVLAGCLCGAGLTENSWAQGMPHLTWLLGCL